MKQPCSVDGQGKLYYHDVGDYLSREDKLQFLAGNSESSIQWLEIMPDEHGDWVNQRDPRFTNLMPLYGEDGSVFKLNSLGIVTARDAWCYGFSREKVVQRTHAMMESFNRQIPTSNPLRDSTEFSWTHNTLRMAESGIRLEHDIAHIVTSGYRPFVKMSAYFDRSVNERVYQQERIFPIAKVINIGIAINARDKNNPLSCLMLDTLPNYHTIGDSQFLPDGPIRRLRQAIGTRRSAISILK